jgi:UDP-glucuronate 4-epimerase
MRTVTGHALVTGAAGFIGSHVVDRLLADGWRVTAIDAMDELYPRAIKEANIAQHRLNARYRLFEGDVADQDLLSGTFDPNHPFDVVLHLAAKAGVRPSLLTPLVYHHVNVTGTLTVLEAARRWRTPHFILASSSSVYGEDPNVPWKETSAPLSPISPYAASKLAAEGLSQVHARLHGMRVSVLRFFTVYGPRQRPDLAIHRFVQRIGSGLPIAMYGDGSTRRDYTFVDDIVAGVLGAVHRKRGKAFEVYNLGNSGTVTLKELITAVEEVVGRKALIDQAPEQPGDVPQTYADITKAARDLGFAPTTALEQGLQHFHAWYMEQRKAGVLNG